MVCNSGLSVKWVARKSGLTFGLKTQGATALAVTPCFSWLRGLDLNQRPLGYEGVGTVHRRRHRTKGAGSYAPRFRLVWSAVGRSTRKMHGKFVRSPRRLHGKAVRLQRARALGRKTQGDLVPQARASSHRRDRSPRRGRRPFPVSRQISTHGRRLWRCAHDKAEGRGSSPHPKLFESYGVRVPDPRPRGWQGNISPGWSFLGLSRVTVVNRLG